MVTVTLNLNFTQILVQIANEIDKLLSYSIITSSKN